MARVIYEPLAKTKLSQLLNTIRDKRTNATDVLHRILCGIPDMTDPVTDDKVASKVKQVKAIFAEISLRRTWNVDQRNQLLQIMAA